MEKQKSEMNELFETMKNNISLNNGKTIDASNICIRNYFSIYLTIRYGFFILEIYEKDEVVICFLHGYIRINQLFREFQNFINLFFTNYFSLIDIQPDTQIILWKNEDTRRFRHTYLPCITNLKKLEWYNIGPSNRKNTSILLFLLKKDVWIPNTSHILSLAHLFKLLFLRRVQMSYISRFGFKIKKE